VRPLPALPVAASPASVAAGHSPATSTAGHSPATCGTAVPSLSPVPETVCSPASVPTPGSIPVSSLPCSPPAAPASEPAVPNHKQLVHDCDALATQLSHVPACREAIKQREKLRAILDAAEKAGQDWDRVGSLGQQLERLEEEASQLCLSAEDYLSLPDRHAALLEVVGARCKEYKVNKQAALLIELGTKLAALKAMDLSCCATDFKGNGV
jgi:hypothetical protein